MSPVRLRARVLDYRAGIWWIGRDHVDELPQEIPVLLHPPLYTIPHRPRGFVAHAQHPLKLLGRNSHLRTIHQVNHQPPVCQRQVRVLKQCPHSGAKLMTALLALVYIPNLARLTPGRKMPQPLPMALRARYPLRPAGVGQSSIAGFFARELAKGLTERGVAHSNQDAVGEQQRQADR